MPSSYSFAVHGFRRRMHCIVGGAEGVDRLTKVLLGLSKDIGQVLGCTTEIQSFIESVDGGKIKGSIHKT